MSSSKKRKGSGKEQSKPLRKKVPTEPVSHNSRLESQTGHRKPRDTRKPRQGVSPIFHEDEATHEGTVVRIPRDDAGLVEMGVSHLDVLAGQCGEKVSDVTRMDIGRARHVLAEDGHEPHQHKHDTGPDCPAICHDADGLLDLVHGLAGRGMNLVPLLEEGQRSTFWMCLQMAYDAGRLGAKVEARPAEPDADKGQRSQTGSVLGTKGRTKQATQERSAKDAEIRIAVRRYVKENPAATRDTVVEAVRLECGVNPQRVRDAARDLLPYSKYLKK